MDKTRYNIGVLGTYDFTYRDATTRVGPYGTLIQFVFIPTIVLGLMNANLIPKRYENKYEESMI